MVVFFRLTAGKESLHVEKVILKYLHWGHEYNNHTNIIKVKVCDYFYVYVCYFFKQ